MNDMWIYPHPRLTQKYNKSKDLRIQEEFQHLIFLSQVLLIWWISAFQSLPKICGSQWRALWAELVMQLYCFTVWSLFTCSGLVQTSHRANCCFPWQYEWKTVCDECRCSRLPDMMSQACGNSLRRWQPWSSSVPSTCPPGACRPWPVLLACLWCVCWSCWFWTERTGHRPTSLRPLSVQQLLEWDQGWRQWFPLLGICQTLELPGHSEKPSLLLLELWILILSTNGKKRMWIYCHK